MNSINEIYKDIYTYLIELGFNVAQAKIILAQTAHETGNFTSKIFKENHNLFGMKYAGQALALGSKYGHAYYRDFFESIKDFARYYKRHKYLPVYSSIAQYIEALKKEKYFEADQKEYEKGVTHFYNLYFVKQSL